MGRMFSTSAANALFALLLTVPPAIAQGTASISGNVSDTSGGSISGARITASNIQTGATRSTEANATGYYTAAHK